MGVLSMPGPFARRGIQRPRPRSSQGRNPVGHFLALLEAHARARRSRTAAAPIVLENVYGCLTSHAGKDFAAIGSALSSSGYRFGAIVINASRFVPQSRPRVFFIAIERNEAAPAERISNGPDPEWHPQSLVDAFEGLSPSAKRRWIWWRRQRRRSATPASPISSRTSRQALPGIRPRRRTIFSVSCRLLI